MIRVLQMPNSIEKRNGRMSVIMNIYRRIDRDKVQFDFVCMNSTYNDYAKEIRELGGKVYFFPQMSFTMRHIRNFVSEILNNNNYNYIHYHAISKCGCALSVASKFGVKVIVQSHSAGLSDSLFKSLRNRIFSLNLLSSKYKRVAISKKAGKKLFMFKSFITIPNMVNYDKFKFNELKREKIRKKFNLVDYRMKLAT